MNRRNLWVVVAAAVLTATVAGPVAAKPEASGPACADIKVQGTYVDPSVDPTLPFPAVRVVITTAAPSCPRIYYSAYVQFSGNNTAGTTEPGNGTNRIELTVYLPTLQNEQWVYLWADSGSRTRRYDIAPNFGSMALQLNDISLPRPQAD